MKKLFIFFALIVPCIIHGQIVNVPSDYPTIQLGIDAANSGDTVLVDTGTYVETINYNGKNITVASHYLITLDTSYISQTIIDGDEASSVVTFENGESPAAKLCGFTLTKGHGSSILVVGGGGGIKIRNNSTPTISRLVIRNNSSDMGGGGLYCSQSNPYLSDILIIDNQALNLASGGIMSYGGGIYLWESNPILNDVTIKNNHTLGWGGGIYCSSSCPYLTNVNIINNSANICGGGIYIDQSSIPIFDSINRCNIYLNKSEFGNDIDSRAISTNINIDTFTVLIPTMHHVRMVQGCYIDILNGKVEQVSADLYVSPGGNNLNSGLIPEEPLQTIYWANTKILADSIHPYTIHLLSGIYSPSNNDEFFCINMPSYVSLKHWGDGAAILDAEQSGRVILMVNNIGSIISGLNIKGGISSHEASGILIINSNPLIQNVVICDNMSRIYGSAIFCSNSSPIIVNSTITNNESYQGITGAVYCYNNSHPEIINSILWNEDQEEIVFSNNAEPNSILISASDIMGGEENINTNNNGYVLWLHGNIDENPAFAYEGDFPYALSDTSPCIDIGSPDTIGLLLPAWDIIGNIRIWDGNEDGDTIIDMGAYEKGSPVWIYASEMNLINKNRHFIVRGFPNPFTTSTTLSFRLFKPENVQFTVYNVQSQIVYTIEEWRERGEQQVQWNAEGLPAGIYYFRIQAGEKAGSGKMVKMR